MSSLELLNAYLKRLEARFRLAALARGAAVVTVVALLATVLIVLATNWLAFSSLSLTAGRIALFLCVAFTLGFGLALPLSKLNRRRTAHETERIVPDFDQRLLTIAEKQAEGEHQPFLELLAADTLELARRRRTPAGGAAVPCWWVSLLRLRRCGHAAVADSGRLRFPGPRSAFVMGGSAARGESQAFYDILVTPGNRTVAPGREPGRHGAIDRLRRLPACGCSPSIATRRSGKKRRWCRARAARPTSSCSRAFRRPSSITPRRAGCTRRRSRSRWWMFPT